MSPLRAALARNTLSHKLVGEGCENHRKRGGHVLRAVEILAALAGGSLPLPLLVALLLVSVRRRHNLVCSRVACGARCVRCASGETLPRALCGNVMA